MQPTYNVQEIHYLEQRIEERTIELKKAKEMAEQAKEKLQWRVNELLQAVTPVRKGDLTIQARVTTDEIGTIADSYNATVNSLRVIVTQVQTITQYVVKATNIYESSVRELHMGASQQAIEMEQALRQIEQMAGVIHQLTIS